MPSKKQRRRREKAFRHEYETVLLDAEGNEIEVDPDELRAEREERRAAKAKPGKGKERARSRSGRALREPPPPTWQRAIRRGALMGGVMLFAFVFLFKDAPLPTRLAWGVFYGAAFVPLTYFIDRTAHRTFQRRQARKS